MTCNSSFVRHGNELGVNKEIINKAKEIENMKKEKFTLALKMGVKIAIGTDASTPFNTIEKMLRN